MDDNVIPFPQKDFVTAEVENLEKTENIHNVSKRQWKKWTEDGRKVFNDLFGTSSVNQTIFHHPSTKPLTEEQWVTVAWNHAWLAADFISMRQKGTVKI